jgi:hypothetical protein
MKLNVTLTVCSIALLAACGGGSSAVNNNPTATTNVQTLKSYSDGSGVLAAENTNLGTAGGAANLLIAATNLTAAREVTLGNVNLQEVAGSAVSFGPFFVITRTGTASNGASLVVATVGENLVSGTEYASISLVTIDNSRGLLSGGSPVNGIPSGTYTYSGTSSVIDNVNGSAGDGTFSLTANFTNNTGTLAATVPANTPVGSNNPAFFFSSNNLQINQSNGSFSSSNALIGQTGVTSNAASVNGYFAGTNATGVHGVVYTNDLTAPTYAGAFYGSR